MFLLAPFAGVWVDRWNRRRLLVVTQCLAMVQSFGLAILAFRQHGAGEYIVPGIIGLAIFQGLINAFDLPGRQAFLIEMVPDREDLANAIALNSTMVHAARLFGPAAAGFLIHYVGAGWCFLTDGFSYVAVVAALLAMRVQPRPRRANPASVMADLREGFAYVWGFRPIRVLLLLMALISLTGMPAFSVLMPIFADALSPPGRGAVTLGFLMGAS